MQILLKFSSNDSILPDLMLRFADALSTLMKIYSPHKYLTKAPAK